MKKLMCRMIGHRYALIEELTAEFRMVGCMRCGETFAMHDHFKSVLPWDEDLDRLAVLYREVRRYGTRSIAP